MRWKALSTPALRCRLRESIASIGDDCHRSGARCHWSLSKPETCDAGAVFGCSTSIWDHATPKRGLRNEITAHAQRCEASKRSNTQSDCLCNKKKPTRYGHLRQASHAINHECIPLGDGLALRHARYNGCNVGFQIPRWLLGKVQQQVKISQAIPVPLVFEALQMRLELALAWNKNSQVPNMLQTCTPSNIQQASYLVAAIGFQFGRSCSVARHGPESSQAPKSNHYPLHPHPCLPQSLVSCRQAPWGCCGGHAGSLTTQITMLVT